MSEEATGQYLGAVRRTSCLLLAFALLPGLSVAEPYRGQDLTELDLEELLDIKVSLASRRNERVRESPASVYVLDSESIRRSGATSIPELLRLVPGVEVARYGSGKWAVSIRGFSGIFTNRLLIQVDGRSVYSQAKIGMFWDELDTLIEDIDHIEVVRGPGTALWGGNAFNGVINIVTKHARDTRGGLAALSAGDEDKWIVGLRYGGELAGGNARAYFKAFERDDSARLTGGENQDAWQSQRLGLRYDRGQLADGELTLIAESYHGIEGESVEVPNASSPDFFNLAERDIHYSGGSILVRWQRQISERSRYSLQAYADHSEREDVLIDLAIDSYDVDFQHDYRLGQHQHLIWGLGYRLTSDDLSRRVASFDPRRRDYELSSAFFQYEYMLPEQGVRFVVGSRAAHNDFSGTEIQPNLRAIWTPDEQLSVWWAVSRAKRVPSRTEHDVTVAYDVFEPTPGVLAQFQIEGDPRFGAEQLTAYQLGWRWRFSPALSTDLALFFNDYNDLRTLEPGTPQPVANPPPQFIVPLVADNGAEATGTGGEWVIRARPRPRWRLELSYSHLQLDIETKPGSADTVVEDFEGASSRHRAQLRSMWDISWGFELSTNLRYVDVLETKAIPSYTELDLQLAKHLGRGMLVSLTGQNLLDKNHEEFLDLQVGTPRAEIERAVYAKLRWNF